jgi:ABC-type sugar transport system ATPase subunit
MSGEGTARWAGDHPAGGLKAEIYRLLRSLARDGVSILMSSSDIEDYVWNERR